MECPGASTRRWPNTKPSLGQRLISQWPSSEPALGHSKLRGYRVDKSTMCYHYGTLAQYNPALLSNEAG